MPTSIIGAKVGRAGVSDGASPASSSEALRVSQLTIDEGSAGQRLDNFLAKVLKGVPRSHLHRVIRSGEVRVNKGRADADTRLAMGDQVRVPPMRVAGRPERPEAPAREFPVVFEDDFFLAIDKPAGLAVHGGSGVSFGVIEQMRQARPQAKFLELVHRLDKETSGLLLLAKRRSALTALQDQLRQRQTGKTYAALVAGSWPDGQQVIDVALLKTLDAAGVRRVRVVDDSHPEGLRSVTLVRLAQAIGGYSLLDVTIKTGRTHQIRVHLSHAGHPIVGDDRYGDFALNHRLARGEALSGFRFERMFLHARELRITHPKTGEAMTLTSPLPPECTALLRALTP